MALRIISILFMSIAVNVYIAVAPSILGALVDYQGLSTDVAGRLLAYNFWGATISTILALGILHRPGWNLRWTMFACLLLVIVTSGASVWFSGDVRALGVVRFVNGLGAGLGFTTAAVAVVGTPRMERTYALLYGATFLTGGVGLALLPYVYRYSGIEGAFYAMGAINLLACGLLPFFPKKVAAADAHERASAPELDRGLLVMSGTVLVALLLHYVFNSGIWAYFERLGVAYGLSPETAGAVLGPAVSASILGMAAAAALGGRLGYLRPIYLGTVVIAIATLSLLWSSSGIVFGLGTALFNVSITFVTPYFVAILASLLPSGLGVSAANVTLMAGFSAGPFLVSFLIADDDFRAAILLTAGGFVAVLAVVAAFARMLRNAPESLEPVRQLCGPSVQAG